MKFNLPDEGNSHIQVNDPEPAYKTNPPTSGNHITAPLQAPDGAYSAPMDPRYTVHSMEHGRVEYQYSPDLPEDQQLAIKGVFDDDPDGTCCSRTPTCLRRRGDRLDQLVGCPKYTPRCSTCCATSATPIAATAPSNRFRSACSETRVHGPVFEWWMRRAPLTWCCSPRWRPGFRLACGG